MNQQLLPPDPFEPDKAESQPVTLATLGKAFKDIFVTLLQSAIVAGFIIYFVAQAHVVHGQSMEPSLHNEQRLIVEKVTYRLDTPQYGDVVVVELDNYETPLIKRVIALPGDTVAIRNNQLFINGQQVEEPYLDILRQRNYRVTTVPEGEVFIMGDNRMNSSDSRYFGTVSIDDIVGRAWFSYWPLEDLGIVE